MTLPTAAALLPSPPPLPPSCCVLVEAPATPPKTPPLRSCLKKPGSEPRTTCDDARLAMQRNDAEYELMLRAMELARVRDRAVRLFLLIDYF